MTPAELAALEAGVEYARVHYGEDSQAYRVTVERLAAAREKAAREREDDEGIPYPAPLGPAAYPGLVGDIVQAVAPETEADPAALVVQLLVGFGNALNAGSHFQVGGTAHHLNECVILVGATARSRKGTSWNECERLFAVADETWTRTRVRSGLSSGEGLIHAVRDSVVIEKRDKATQAMVPTTEDSGVDDKRLLVLESEFASPLTVMQRDGNTLSAVLRLAWDARTLRTMTRNCPLEASDPHVSLVGHITGAELRRRLDRTDLLNGLLNRFMLICVRDARDLPFGGDLSVAMVQHLGGRLGAALFTARQVGPLAFSPAARPLWASAYGRLKTGFAGLLGAALSRAEAHALRLSGLFALITGADRVEPEHLAAALEVWRYATDSARYVFGHALGDPLADVLYLALDRAGRGGLTRGEIYESLGRHKERHAITAALRNLEEAGLVLCTREPTAGRPIERWRLRMHAR